MRTRDGDIESNTQSPAFITSALEKHSLQVHEINNGSSDVMCFFGFEDFFDSRLVIHS